MRPFRRRAEPDEAHADLVGDVLDVAQVGVHLVAGLVDGLKRRARQFELPARFEADIRAVLFQPDELARLLQRLPAVPVAQALQHGQHAVLAVIGDGVVGVLAIAELLVLGADAPVRARFAAAFQIIRELGAVLDRPAAGLGDGHVLRTSWLLAR
jgi:hypothetical protein